MLKKRSSYLVNSRLQLTILAYGFIVALSGNCIVAIFQAIAEGRISFLHSNALFFFATALSFLLACILVMLGLVVSNRIAGPIYNLRNHMEAVLQDEKPELLKIRKEDYFAELVGPYNSIIGKLK